MKFSTLAFAGLVSLTVGALGCTAGTDEGDQVPAESTVSDTGATDDDFTSANATLLDFEFDGEVVASSNQSLANKVRAQLIFTVGEFNEYAGGPRLNAVTLTNLKAESIAGGLYRVRYHAKLPVAWNTQYAVPKTFRMVLPRRVDAAGQAAFFAKWGTLCTEPEGHQVTASNVWFHYRPNAATCTPDATDFMLADAKVTKSPLNSASKYPEYHRVWEDGVLSVVAVFGKYEAGATSGADAGVAAYDEFVATMRAMYPDAATTPAALPTAPGVGYPDVTFEAEVEGGRLVLTALLVDEVASASPSFDKRFAELTPDADVVFYGGHAGLGANVRALTQKAQWFPGKHQLLFLNGCDTFSYEDDALNAARRALNPDDPSGGKYLDVLRNAMPAYFHSLPTAAAALLDALQDPTSPKSYQQIFKQIDPAQVVLVTGEEDNVYGPTFAPGARWSGFESSATVAYNQTVTYETAELPAGKYVFEMTPEPSAPGGDADLYVRAGQAPTATSTYKCPSYKYNSNERCFVTLTKPGKVSLLARGDKKTVSSSYLVRGFQRYE